MMRVSQRRNDLADAWSILAHQLLKDLRADQADQVCIGKPAWALDILSKRGLHQVNPPTATVKPESSSGSMEAEMSRLQDEMDYDFDPFALDLQVELYKKAFADYAHLSRAEQSAQGLVMFLSSKNIRVKSSDLFVGHL